MDLKPMLRILSSFSLLSLWDIGSKILHITNNMIKKILLHALYGYISSCHMYVFIIYHIIMMQKSDITSYSLVSIRSCTKNINPQKMIITTQ